MRVRFFRGEKEGMLRTDMLTRVVTALMTSADGTGSLIRACWTLFNVLDMNFIDMGVRACPLKTRSWNTEAWRQVMVRSKGWWTAWMTHW